MSNIDGDLRVHLRTVITVAAAAFLLTAAGAVARLGGGSSMLPVGQRPQKLIEIEDGGVLDEANVRTARETASHSANTPTWTNPPGFEEDVFVFARLLFHSDPGRWRGRGLGPRLGWWVDYPDADLNLSWRLQQMTSLRTDPDARVVRLMDADLGDFPLIYLEHAGYMKLADDEVLQLRRYLQNGGVLFVNDFWSAREWDGFAGQMDRVLPASRWEELTTDHPVFHCLFDLRRPLHELRIPTMQLWNEDFDPRDPNSEPHRIDRGEGSERMTIRAIFDDQGRPQILAIHNSDVSDGWEREGESDTYFDRFSEKVAYPLGLNIIFYLMTH